MKVKQLIVAAFAGVLTATSFAADMPTNPIDGKPPAGSKPSVDDMEFQVKKQRAFEAVVWSIPAVATYNFRRAFTAIGAEENTILAFSKPATADLEVITANTQTPYIWAFSDLREGPVVLEVPAATDKASTYAQITDHWQITLGDVGFTGLDKGKGGKFLMLPPDYKGEVPEGYFAVKSKSNRITVLMRCIPGKNGTTEDAYAFAKEMKMYYLNDPIPTKFINPSNKRVAQLNRYDERWFEDLNEIIQAEPVLSRDKVMMGYLASLGIEKGKPYQPDEKTKKAMREGVIDAYFYMKTRWVTPKDPAKVWWKGKHWMDGLFHDKNRQFIYEYDNMLDVDNRSDRYYAGTFYPLNLPKLVPTQYLYSMFDKDGKQLEAGKTYSFTMPADAPVKQFWSMIVYDIETNGFIYNKETKYGLSSYELDKMKKNDDGSVTMYFGPKPPKDLESNWLPTAGKQAFPIIRFYGGNEKFWDKSWTMPDLELVK